MDKAEPGASAPSQLSISDVTASVNAAKAAIAAGDLPLAAAWIGRARRLAPDDTTVTILYASIVARRSPAQAVSVLQELVANQPEHREAGLALMAAQHRAGRPAEAAALLGGLLGRFAVPDDASIRGLVSEVCNGAGEVGWIGLDGAGRCSIVLAAATGARTVTLWLDGRRVASLRSNPPGVVRALPEAWQLAGVLEARCEERLLLGSGVRPSRFAAVEGYAEARTGGWVEGWARLPADPATPPAVFLGGEQLTLERLPASPDGDGRDRWSFRVRSGDESAAIVDGQGRSLWGSPVLLGPEQTSARQAAEAFATGRAPDRVDRFRPLPTDLLPVLPLAAVSVPARRRPPCDLIIPVYGGLTELRDCLRSVSVTLPRSSRLIIVDDGSPDPDIAAELAVWAGGGAVVLRHERARGFPGAVNAGLAQAGAGRDVVILNSDTLVPPRWLERLSAAAYSDGAIGSCTPLTNDGTIVSYPLPGEPDPAPDAAGLAALDELCRQAAGAEVAEIPTGVGFCMFIKGACLAQIGPFREDVFAQGYGEENDWCLRAAHLGWRHVAVPGVFVAHRGGRSFGAGKALLMQRNAAVIERLHPGYGRFVAEQRFVHALAPARCKIDRLRLLRTPGHAATVLVTHNQGGGVRRFVASRCHALIAQGRRPIVLQPGEEEATCCAGLSADGGGKDFPNLRFRMPGDLASLAQLLRDAGADMIEVHHLLGHDRSVMQLPELLDVPYEVYVHDYAHWCPRVTLTSRTQRYCGEPLALRECENCVADLGARYAEDLTVGALRAWSGGLLSGASRVVTSCNDAASRVRRQFPGIKPEVVAWEPMVDGSPGRAPGNTPSRAQRDITVVTVGSIGIEKGYDVLLGCARDAARRDLPLRFTVVGHTIDDERLMDTGRAFVTGRFEDGEGLALLCEQQATLGFLPSVCPETWSYALSMLFEAGLPVVGFALGAQGERIAATSNGLLLPLGIASEKINDALVNRARSRLI